MPRNLLVLFVSLAIFLSLLLKPQMPWDVRTQEQEWEAAGYVGHVGGVTLYGYEYDETDDTRYPIGKDSYAILSAPNRTVGYSDFHGSSHGTTISDELRDGG